MMKRLRLSDALTLPVEAVTQTFGILGKRGSGKSNAGRVLAEEMFAAGLPFCVIDPVGSWYGLRASRDGKGPGLSVPIFGGDHGDVALERGSGQELADLVAEERLSCVLDISVLSESDKVRFLTDFAERLFQRNRDPIHLFLEESDDFIPQRVMSERARLVGAWQRIVKRGRGRGLGATMITQRSAALNKDVLTQCESLLVFRTTAPQDMKAIEGWLQFHGQKTDVLVSLPSLRDGECWVWSPHWLGKLVRTRIRLSETFDSGATPGVAGRRAPATLADIDLGAVRKRMAAAVERAKATDPKALQAEVARLKASLARTPAPAPAVAPREVRVEVPVLKDGQLKRLEGVIEKLLRGTMIYQGLASSMAAEGEKLRQVLLTVRNGGGPVAGVARVPAAAAPALSLPASAPGAARQVSGAHQAAPRSRGSGLGASASEEVLPQGERRILAAVLQTPGGATRSQLTVVTGFRRSTRDTYLQRLRAKGYVDVRGGVIVVTDAGRAVARDVDPLPTGAALRAYWLARLPEGQRKLLEILIDAYPDAIDREHLSERTGLARSSRDTYLQRLTARQLVTTVGRGTIRASELLF
jgi:hypothetical protein